MPDKIEENERLKTMNIILNRVGDKWTVMVFGALFDGPVRFNEIQRAIGTISQRMLTLTLRNLERDGLVIRTAYAEIPPRVEYQFSELGKTLIPAMHAIWDWSSLHHNDIITARMAYDSRNDGLKAAAE